MLLLTERSGEFKGAGNQGKGLSRCLPAWLLPRGTSVLPCPQDQELLVLLQKFLP